MSCASSWRVAPCGNGASVVLPASGVVCSAPVPSVAANLVASSGAWAFAACEGTDADVVAGAEFAVLPAGSTAITRLSVPDGGTFGCGAVASDGFVSSASALAEVDPLDHVEAELA